MVSQPAISRMLSYTEQRTGLTLFERVRGRLCPTPEARRLFQDVEHVYRDVQRINSTVKDLRQQQQGILRLASSPSLGHQLLPEVIHTFHQRCPDVRVSFECMRHILLQNQVIDGYVDLAISLFPFDHPNLLISKQFPAKLLFVCSSEHPLTQADAVHFSDLENEVFVGYTPETPFCELTQSVFAERSVHYSPSIEVSSPQYACSMVKSGLGIALVDAFSYKAHRDDKIQVLPLVTPYQLHANLLYLRHSPISQTAQIFINIFQQHLREDQPLTSCYE